MEIVKRTQEEQEQSGLLSARYYAHELELKLHLSFWVSGDEFSYNYHREQAREAYNMLTQQMCAAGIIASTNASRSQTVA